MNTLAQDIVCRTAAIVASHPFNVIAVRMMAEFVGGENKYRCVF
jgi:carrier protein